MSAVIITESGESAQAFNQEGGSAGSEEDGGRGRGDCPWTSQAPPAVSPKHPLGKPLPLGYADRSGQPGGLGREVGVWRWGCTSNLETYCGQKESQALPLLCPLSHHHSHLLREVSLGSLPWTSLL